MVDGVVNAESYGESRIGAKFDFTLFVGLQIIMLEHLEGEVVKQWMIDEAKFICLHHLGAEEAMHIKGWQRIVDEFDGRLPLRIKAVPEGTCVPVGQMHYKVTATAKGFQWLVNYVEGLLQKYWYPSTVATQSKVMVDFVKRLCAETSDHPEIYQYLIHDFGYRSTTCEDQARIGGMAHIINSMGTDTVEALRTANRYYAANYAELAKSVPASEHRVSCHFGPGEGEFKYVEDLLKKYPDGPLSLVADTYGIENFVKEVICSPRIKAKILARREASDHPLTQVVVRPDSPRFKGDTPQDQVLWIVEVLAKHFGFDTNSKKYKVLNPAVGCIYGDGLAFNEIVGIYLTLTQRGWATETAIVGQGGGLLQKVNRDTQRSAIKCSAEQLESGEWVDIQKNPSDKSKASKAGRLKLVKHHKTDGSFEWDTINEKHPLYHDMPDELVTVFENGKILKFWTWREIKERADSYDSTLPTNT